MTNLAESSLAEDEVIFACDMTAIKPGQREEHIENLECRLQLSSPAITGYN